jgi:hypothetical protein
MGLDANLAISISLVGITVITALVVIVNILTGRSKEEKNNHQSPMTG